MGGIGQELPAGYESAVVFEAPLGARVAAHLRRLSWHSAAFEVPGSWPALRISERIPCVRIWAAGLQVYTGPGVVTALVDAGTGYVGELKLDPEALNRALVGHNGKLYSRALQTFDTFLKDWQAACRLLPEYKVAVADLHSFLSELRLWLKQGQLAASVGAAAEDGSGLREWAARLSPRVTEALGQLFRRYEEAASRIEPALVEVHYRFGRQLIHHVLLCSPFVRRSFQKPLGYSGDYEVVNMMFRDPLQGETILGMLINAYALQLPPIAGHRNRIAYLKRILQEEAARVVAEGNRPRIFSLGCGPAHEIQQFLAESPLSDFLDATLADFNEETLAHTERVLEEQARRFARRPRIRFLRQSAQEFIREAERLRGEEPAEGYDVAYCAGLFDYLSDRVCRRLLEILYQKLRPGGLLIATNVDHHAARYEMECFLDWHLIYRDTSAMAALVPPNCPAHCVSIKRESTGVNIFLEVRKEAR
ncbi:class I SAM-dependent methyltransferase [Limisphaera sp. 4302-co]|uniref:class I SAM-dependent methyltransferase n=1 Tax=Limisphaera sp. 4302-co TaxID=3400417 RepID=UPI003C1B7005